ncbi:uracil-DNA glycosylase family protein [Lacisediminimonas sp.]|uniref:uracil-DNA glycosylase n=1 Tax=Lacisediminimonas sp. TaxID=3060582 RepID=UPI00271A5048|nr:uracil-DNA glycosylase [Lacisediminimonas sp.]MDO8299495.1 uracil-DNA glycosylase [Lacisediminimonas sp.]
MTYQDSRRKILLEQLGVGPVWTLRQSPTMPVAPGPIEEDIAAHDAAGAAIDAVLPRVTADDGHSSVSMSVPVPAGLDWPALEQAVAACTACGLCHGRTNTVFGVGDRKARWFFVGEGPGRQEDLQGDPFVGPAGRLLDNMIRALGLQRGENTYIANVVKCRPLAADGGDRPPAAAEVATCLPFLQRQIELVQPDVIVALGKSAAVSLLGLQADTPVASLRGRMHTYRGLPLVVTYHPAYLLRQPADKAKAWRDLCLAMTAHAAAA